MVLPKYYLVSSYKSAMCAVWKCYLQVYRLFLLFPLSSEKPLICLTPLALNSASPLLNLAGLPHACVPSASPRVRTSALVSSAFKYTIITGDPSTLLDQ